jgi:hypothetical protein
MCGTSFLYFIFINRIFLSTYICLLSVHLAYLFDLKYAKLYNFKIVVEVFEMT